MPGTSTSASTIPATDNPGGRFEDGTISRWLEEAESVFDAFAEGPQILVGSSMGGWLALLLARRLRERGDTDRLAGMVLHRAGRRHDEGR